MNKIKTFLLSPFYTLLLLLLMTGAITTHNEILGTVILGVIASLCLVLSETITPFLETVLLVCCFAIRCKYSFNEFMKYKFFVLPIIIFAIARFIIYPIHFKKGNTFWGIFATSVAVTLGGVGSLTAKQYFSETSIFYIFMLGFGQLFFYCLFCSYFDKENKSNQYDISKGITKALFIVIPAMFICLSQEYISRWSEFINVKTVIPFQWRNNCATLLMLAMPFAFHLTKKHFGFFILGMLSFIEIVLTGSRGGLIFGAVEMIICIIVCFNNNKDKRKPILIFMAICLVLAIPLAKILFGSIRYTIERLFDWNENKIRFGLLSRCIDDFISSPIFGKGLIYMGNRDLHESAKFALCWYHNSAAQIIGSFGITGIFCYPFLAYKRLVSYKSSSAPLKTVMLLSYIGLNLMSLVNPGIFAPFPYLFMLTLFWAYIDEVKCENISI